jgi:very-short-patch-repair endonuclease
MKRNNSGSGVTSLQYVDKGKKNQARALRRQATPAERVLWKRLRNRKVAGLKFRRQQIIEGFIADFFCEDAKLVIEVDGGVHGEPEQQTVDAHRKNVFAGRGLFTLRLSNEAVLQNITETIDLISTVAQKRIKE